MKKMVLGLSLAALSFLLSPAMAAAQQSTADLAFLSSLAAPVAPVPAAKGPGLEKALCTAAASCGDGTSVYCEGNNSTASCTAVDRNCPERGRVTCDGVTTWCPTACPGCPEGSCSGAAACAASCYPCAYTYTCNTTYCFDTCRCKFSTCPV
jgi:hypothetical protein